MRARTSIPIIALHLLPGLLFLSFALGASDEYLFPVYLLTAAAFLAASIGAGYRTASRQAQTAAPAGTGVFIGLAVAWLLALTVMGVLNLTPLCIGQDNGDGINGIGECTMYTMIAGVLYSAVVVPVIALVALTAGRLVRRMLPQ